MREILFRGKRVDNGEWIKGFYIEANHHWHNKGVHKEWIVKNVIQNGGWCNVGSKYAVIPETVGQYTGLTDKNGTKIFEGDIVKDEYILGKVVYNTKQEDFDGAASFMIDDVDDGLQSYRFWNSVEVIGNIHDNPELIGGAENG